ncbi:hypothetical protein ACFOTA_18845 [Chitinophaga sp. GCM10012297]|uniref:HEAT repeat domain-containing protein n=1 Tax=Chitinophaga chungangae TaxID=2821488 RepID=A0ABS3YHW7_9BACT|nr:hypothetical protein [Chitinophaga chungangae]MBO9154281.1 hypothetical protein [Chitinophaga chungangae]
MELRDEILRESSKANTMAVVAWAGDNPERIAQLVDLFLHGEYRVVQRAAWILSYVSDKHPELIQPHLAVMVDRMGHPGIPVAVKRNVVRILRDMPVPETLQGPVMHFCFQFLEDPKETVAVKAFSMAILGRLAKIYPDIRNEIVMLIEDHLREGATPGIRSRGIKTLKELGALKKTGK